jgi:glycerol-3-phosphate O-acyltransferase
MACKAGSAQATHSSPATCWAACQLAPSEGLRSRATRLQRNRASAECLGPPLFPRRRLSLRILAHVAVRYAVAPGTEHLTEERAKTIDRNRERPANPIDEGYSRRPEPDL